MRFALVVDGVVTNLILAPSQEVADHFASRGEAAAIETTDQAVEIGWTWDGSTFAPPPAVDEDEEG